VIHFSNKAARRHLLESIVLSVKAGARGRGFGFDEGGGFYSDSLPIGNRIRKRTSDVLTVKTNQQSLQLPVTWKTLLTAFWSVDAFWYWLR
jgi:hypothetical protein